MKGFVVGFSAGILTTLVVISFSFVVAKPSNYQDFRAVCASEAYNQELTSSSLQKGVLKCYYNVSPQKAKKFKGI